MELTFYFFSFLLENSRWMFTLTPVTWGYCEVVKVDEINKRRRAMKRLVVSVFIMVLAGAVLFMSPVWGMEKNLSVNPEMTARIQAFDPEDFTKGFDVYAAEDLEAPTALLFDMKDDYHLPSTFWGKPLSQEEIVFAIHRLKDQFLDYRDQLPFAPRALNVVNRNGKVLGYIYVGGIDNIVMDRKKDGMMLVKVFPPSVQRWYYSYPNIGVSQQGRDGNFD
jgi:hypothetical protein